MRLLIAILLVIFMPQGVAWGQFSSRAVSNFPVQVQIEDPNAIVPPDLRGSLSQMNPQGVGYQKYRIEFSDFSNAKVLEDKEIDFTFTIGTGSRSAPTCSVRFKIPKGEASSFTEVLVPVPDSVYLISFETHINGTRVTSLCSEEPVHVQNHIQFSTVLIGDEIDYQSASNASGVRMVVSPLKGMFGSLLTVTHPSTRYRGLPPGPIPGGSPALASSNYAEYHDLRFMYVDHIPNDDMEWSTANNVFLSSRLLDDLNKSQTECLKRYVRKSGLLIVYGESSADELAAQCSQWLSPEVPIEEHVWEYTTFDTTAYNSTIVGMGHVAVLPFMPTDKLLSEPHVRTHIASSQNTGKTSYGPSSVRQQAFWNWHLTRLGQPPVGAFAILIGLFAGLVAPALLIYCIRSNRTVWLLVIFPVIAVIGTLALVTFAVVHDGFGTHSRVRSFTMLDLNSNQGVCLSRQVIFSGLTPKEQIYFDKSTEAWPLEQMHTREIDGGRIGWIDNKQVFDRVIRPREQFQFSTCQNIDQFKPFEWIRYPTPKADDPNTLECEIKNLLNESISLAIVTDGNGNGFQARNIGPTATAVLQRVDPSSASLALSRQEETQPLEPPIGLRGGQPAGIIESFLGIRRYARSMGLGTHDIILNINRRLMRREYLADHKCFFIYPVDGRHVDRALENSDEQDSLHMIYGQWGNAK